MRQPSILKIFLTLSILTALFFLIIGSTLLSKPNNFDSKLLKIDSISFTDEQITTLIAMEIPFLGYNVQADGVQSTISNIGLKWLDIFSFYAPNGPNDWIKQEIPIYSLVSIDKNNQKEKIDDFKVELEPPVEFFEAEKEKSILSENNSNQNSIPVSSKKENIVFIYHTHNRESFLPELGTNKTSEAYHPANNITMVGKRLAEELEKLGIGSSVSTRDYWTELKTGEYYLSYKLSLETVQAVLQESRDIKYIFDIHRDAGNREKTTQQINGVNYATIYFVIGEENKNYQQNKEFAIKIHESLEQHYPGLSRGIVEKEKTSGSNGEYNQSISPYSLTVEIGGVYNTFEEEYRTAKALAVAIADVYWEAEKVNAQFDL